MDLDGAPDVVAFATSNLAALSVFLEHPVIGVGPDQYFRNYSQDAGNQLGLKHFDRNRQAHSMYLEVLADTGIVMVEWLPRR